MSRSKTDSDIVPTKSLALNLDLHGFELVESAPAAVTAEVVRGIGGTYDLDIKACDGHEWRIELYVHPSGHMKVGAVFEEGSLIADETDSDLPGLDDLDEWLRYTVRHVTGEVAHS